MATTKHTCGGPIFGKKTVGCPRCDELLNGAAPIKWRGTIQKEWERKRIAAIRAHDCIKSKCGPVCTAFDW